MDTETTTPAPPALDEYTTGGVLALLIRVVQLDDELTRDRERLELLNARVAENTVVRGKAVQAFSVFGFDTSDGLWARVRAAVGDHAYDRSIAIAKGQDYPLLLEMGVDDDAKDDVSDSEAKTGAQGTSSGRSAPPIRDAILEYLRGLQGAGVTVRDVKQHLLNAYEITTHEKTPGMTLYRLLKEGKVRREGRVWFYKEQDTDKTNEGAGLAVTPQTE